MPRGRWLGWCLAGLLLAAPAARSEEGTAPRDRLFPLGVRTDARPDRAPRGEKARAETIAAGLRWLAAHQHERGHWEPEQEKGFGKSYYGPGVTGLAVAAFLASGYTHLDGSPYAPVVRKGLNVLSGVQDKEGCFAPRVSQHFLYNHAFACLAFVEAYAITGDDRLLPFARRGLAFSERARNPALAWRYGVKPGDNDTSLTGCVCAAFLVARRVNDSAVRAQREPPLPFRQGTLDGARAWVDRMTDPASGRTGYIHPGGSTARPMEFVDSFPGELSEACTGIGLLIRLLVPREGDEELNRRAVRLLHAVPPRWEPDAGRIDLYYWYYGALALAERGGNDWAPWREAVDAALRKGQRQDGTVADTLGSWDPCDPWGVDGGRPYSTAMALLLLQTARRFPRLPDDRADLVTALRQGDRKVDERIRLLEAIALYGVPGGADVLEEALASSEARERAAAARALVAGDLDPSTLQTLARLLKKDADADVRQIAAEGLGRKATTHPAVVSALRKGATDKAWPVQVASLEALRGCGSKAQGAAEGLTPLLRHDHQTVRVAAAGALARIAPETPDVEKTLFAGLRSPEVTARWRAARYLAADAGPQASGIHAALTKALQDDHVRVKVEAARGVVRGRYDDALLLDVLGAGLRSEERGTRLAALALVTDVGEVVRGAAPMIAPGALDGPLAVRLASIRALEALGPKAEDAVVTLHACMEDPVPAVHLAAAKASARLRVQATAVVPALLEALESDDPRLVRAGERGLALCGEHAVSSVRQALPLADDAEQVCLLSVLAAIGAKAKGAAIAVFGTLDATSSAAVKIAAAHALGAMQTDDAGAVRRLEDLLDEKEAAVRRAAATGLGGLAPHLPQAVEVLGRLVERTEESHRGEREDALRALEAAGPAAAPALEPLLRTLDDPDEGIRSAAAAAVAAIGEKGLDGLLESLSSPSERARQAASQAIASMGARAKPIASKLSKGLGASATFAAYDYARALAGGGKPSTRLLKKHLRSKKAVVRAAAAHGLGLIGREAKSACAALKRLQTDRDPNVRREAGIALKRIRGG